MQNTASNIMKLAKSSKQLKSLAFHQCNAFANENGELTYSFADGSKLVICNRIHKVYTV